jgi:hypothetical protein
MQIYGDGIHLVQPAVDWRLEGTSAWINMLTGRTGRLGVKAGLGKQRV